MNETRKAYEVLATALGHVERCHNEADRTATELIAALKVALPLVESAIKCDRCGRNRAVELSETGMSYCKRCWKAVTDGRTPY